jgi:hypothetical protein
VDKELGQHEFIDTTAKWGRDFVEVLNPLKENEILRVYHDLSQRSKLEPYNPLENNADYERGYIDGQQKQIELAVHKAVKRIGDREWVGLTDEEIKDILDCGRPNLVNIKKAEQKLKEKNGF